MNNLEEKCGMACSESAPKVTSGSGSGSCIYSKLVQASLTEASVTGRFAPSLSAVTLVP